MMQMCVKKERERENQSKCSLLFHVLWKRVTAGFEHHALLPAAGPIMQLYTDEEAAATAAATNALFFLLYPRTCR